MKEMLCDECKHATADCCEYYGGYKQWFIDGCDIDADIEAEKDENGFVVSCEEYERVKEDWPE